MKKYASLDLLVEDIKNDVIPSDVVSPGGAAAILGVTRQAIHQRLKCGSLRAWAAEGVILIDVESLAEASKKKLGIPEGQGELNVSI
jgi:hypothetical protein